MPKCSSNRRMKGPIAAEALLSLALPSNKALRPSKSRRLTSLPSAQPLVSPRLLTASTISGSGLFQTLLGCRPISAPTPTALMGWDLVNISASSPIPTSRYWDHTPWPISTSRNRAACADPGLTLRRLSPITLTTERRTASARPASPRACSSMTRSSIDATNVTPAALIACRSHGASNHALPASRCSTSVLASTAAVSAMGGPPNSRTVPTGSAISSSCVQVGASREIS